MANDIPFDRNAPVDHFKYLDAKQAKPVLLLMLEHATLPDLTTMRLHDNLWNFISQGHQQIDNT